MISVVLSLLMLGVFLVGMVARKRSPPVAVGIMSVALVGIWFAWRPDDLTSIAHWMGVGRGTDLGLYLAISLCLPWCQMRGANIIVDFFTQNATKLTQRRLDAIGALLIAAMYLLLAWRTTVGAVSVRQAHEQSMILELPMWWAYASLAPGLALAGMVALLQAWGAWQGREIGSVDQGSA